MTIYNMNEPKECHILPSISIAGDNMIFTLYKLKLKILIKKKIHALAARILLPFPY